VAMVFQSLALYPHLTVYGNMALGLKLRRESRFDIDRKVRETAGAMDIADLLDRKPARSRAAATAGGIGPGPGAEASGLPAG